MRHQGTHAGSSLIQHAREMRQRWTPAEKLMWSVVRNRRLGGWKIRRQVQIDGFILDFYCPELKLAIEIDGDVHADDKSRAGDGARTRLLGCVGIAVIRFENDRVLADPDAVGRRVSEALERRAQELRVSEPVTL